MEHAVSALVRKYKTAKELSKEVQLAFRDLTSGIGNPLWIKQWEQLEAQAMEKRGGALMIYNVSPVNGTVWFLGGMYVLIKVASTAVTQAGKREEILSRISSKETNEQVAWIWTGILIESDQYVIIHCGCNLLTYIIRYILRSQIRAMGKHPSPEEQMKIQDRREALQAKVEAFHQQGLRFIQTDSSLPTNSFPGGASEVLDLDLEESDEEGFFLDGQSEWEEEDLETNIERALIRLPSSFTKTERAQMGLEQVAEVEAELREGQANDALEELRAGLAEKSLRFRTKVKPAKSQKTMTRAWDSINRADKQIRAAVQSYCLARTALEGLEVSSKLLDKYKVIQKRDLRMSGDIVEENRVGQRSSQLPWFWRLDNKWEEDRGEFLKECMWSSVNFIH